MKKILIGIIVMIVTALLFIYSQWSFTVNDYLKGL
ncbi:hypothetical protein LCGC14_0364790 [marine sediment metagenome]|uniref:Uncharacterized protein n=1 Tax=marine sediment metagenome TaxID=412755 RepID=A0A0F9TPV3_9ZZZZ